MIWDLIWDLIICMYLLEQSLIKGIKLILDDLGFDHLHVFARAKFG
jgi:hypothetical protein